MAGGRKSVRAIWLDTLSDELAAAIERDADFQEDLNNLLVTKGLVVRTLVSTPIAKEQTDGGTNPTAG